MFFHCHPQFSSLNGKARQPDPPLLTNPRLSRIAECTRLSSYGHSPTKIIPLTKQVTNDPPYRPDGHLLIRARDNEMWNDDRKPKPDISASASVFSVPQRTLRNYQLNSFVCNRPHRSPQRTLRKT